MRGEPPDQSVPPDGLRGGLAGQPTGPGGPGLPGERGVPGEPGETAGALAVKRRSPLLPILALVVLGAVIALGVAWLTRGDESVADDPVTVVQDYFAAVSHNDCDAAVGMADSDGEPGEQDRAGLIELCQQAYESAQESIEGARLVSADLMSQDGDHATVRAQVVTGGAGPPNQARDIPLVRVDGDWKIDLGAAPAAEGAGGGATP